jgi:preprotein translocase subunit SecB
MSEIQKTNATTADDNSYIKFITSLHLVGLGLKSSSAELHRDILFEIQSGQPARTFTQGYRHVEIGEDYFDVEGQFAVTVADGEQLGVRIECVFEAHFHCSQPQQTMIERFTEQDLRFMILPYARSFVSDMCGKMQIPPIMLPLATAAGMARPNAKKRRLVKGLKEATVTP